MPDGYLLRIYWRGKSYAFVADNAVPDVGYRAVKTPGEEQKKMDFSHITKNWKKSAGIASLTLLCGSALVYTAFFHEEEAVTSTSAVSKSVETATGSNSDTNGKAATTDESGKAETQEVAVKETSGTEAGMATAPGGNVTVVTGKEEFTTAASAVDSDATATNTTAASPAGEKVADTPTSEATAKTEKTVEETYAGTITDDGYVVTGEAVDGEYTLSSAGVEDAVYVDAEAGVYYLQKEMTTEYFKANAAKLVVSSLKQAEAKHYKQATLAE